MGREPDFYQQHKDDPRVWEPSPTPSGAKRRKRLDAMVSVRFSPEEEAMLREEATRRGVSLSKLVRIGAISLVTRTVNVVGVTETTAVRAMRTIGSHLVDARPLETLMSNATSMAGTSS